MQDHHKDDTMDMALWRYGIISPLLHRNANETGLYEMLAALAGQMYVRPDGRFVNLSPETLRKWLYRYQHGGLPALTDQDRSDKGTHNIPDAVGQAMFDLRKDHPRWTLAHLFENLVISGVWNGRKPSRSTLYRFAQTHNLARDPHLAAAAGCRPFAFDAFGQLWMADFLHGPKLWIGKRKRKTYLHAIMDDCTRYVVAAGFYPAETVEHMITSMMSAVRKFGIPQRFYTDNGACYASRHLKIVCARMKMQLVHTPPYRPQGRAKIERFFRTIRDRFLCSDHSKTLAQINLALQKWLAGYHESRHSTLKCSPVEKRLKAENACQPLPDVVDIEALFRMERRCRVYKDGTVHLYKRCFEVPQALPGTRVRVYFIPWDLSCVYYGDDMTPARPVDPSTNARRFDHPNRKYEKEQS
jgi:transposase InsO family protein